METKNQIPWDKNNSVDNGRPDFIALFEKYYGETLKMEEAQMRAERLIRLVKIVYNL